MITIIDYGMGNLSSIANMFKKVGAESVITSEAAVIERADKLILPGVGAFDSGMKNLAERGLIPILSRRVLEDKTPILGLCLGMQLFTQRSEEGQLPGLGWLKADTVRFSFNGAHDRLKVPHMGWNTIDVRQQNSIYNNINEEPRFYFVHSYHVRCYEEDDILATTSYGYEFTSSLKRGNIIGTQFHPEKSHKFGMRVFKNFVDI